MNRYDKYKESIQKFMASTTINDLSDDSIKKLVSDYVTKDNKMIPTLLLTILNSQNKKNNVSIQGYHLAMSIECLLLLTSLYNDKNSHLLSKILTIKNFTSTLLSNNLNDIKNSYTALKVNNVYVKSYDAFNNYVKQIDKLCDFKFDVIQINIHQDVSKWYIRDDKSNNAVKLSQLNQIKKESFEKYMESSIVIICEYAIVMGWLLGNGEAKLMPKLKQLSRYFAYIFKISRDFANIENDINNMNNDEKWSNNYVINYGLQESYNIFIKNKIKFTEESIALDLLTPTIKEILECATKNIDDIIDQTSPDIKSGFSKIF